MPSILVVTGSVRPNNVNEKVVPHVVAQIEKQGSTAVVADLKALDLPFFDGPISPASPDYVPTGEGVIEWTKLVTEADGVVFVTPEYNHTLTPVQLNAIDWIATPLTDKPVALVGYGWGGASLAHATAHEVLGVQLKVKLGNIPTNLYFTKDLSPDGAVLDQPAVDEKIATTVTELLANI